MRHRLRMAAGLNTNFCCEQDGRLTYSGRRFALSGIVAVAGRNFGSNVVTLLNHALRGALISQSEQRENEESDFRS